MLPDTSFLTVPPTFGRNKQASRDVYYEEGLYLEGMEVLYAELLGYAGLRYGSYRSTQPHLCR